MYKKIIIIMFVFFITGCTSMGNTILKNEDRNTVSLKITTGITTKDDVRKMFGDPMKTNFIEGGLEIWIYNLENLSADAISYIVIFGGSSYSGKKKELVILFDDKDVVAKYSMSNSDISIKHGIFNLF